MAGPGARPAVGVRLHVAREDGHRRGDHPRRAVRVVARAASGDGASAGGAGLWNATLLNWDPGAGGPHANWSSATPDSAVLGGVPGLVTLGSPITAGSVTLNAAGYILENGRVVMEGDAKELASNEDVKEFYLGLSSAGRKSFRDVKHYRRRKRWLS